MNDEYKKFFNIVDNKVIVKVPYMKVYLPEDYFQHSIAEIIGEEIVTFGLFYFDIYGADSKKFDEENPFKHPERYLYKLPTEIIICPSDIKHERGEDKRLTCVAEFVEGDIFIKSIGIKKDWKIVNKVLELLIQGFLPKELAYDEVVDFMNKSCEMNSTSLNIADTILETMVAALYRDRNDNTKPFRLVIRDNPSVKMTAGKFIKMETLARNTNSFAGLSSGDPKQAITIAISRERNKEGQKPSAIEEALRDV